MTRRDTVLQFLKCFSDGDVDGLERLLTEDLRFSGPFYYPPEPCRHRVLSLAESGDDVCVFYDYEKAGQSITVAQLCRFKGERIGEILLVFDSGSLS
jgi:ketosteroid isomerase-like protein